VHGFDLGAFPYYSTSEKLRFAVAAVVPHPVGKFEDARALRPLGLAVALDDLVVFAKAPRPSLKHLTENTQHMSVAVL
jgi:hypothetical protein